MFPSASQLDELFKQRRTKRFFKDQKPERQVLEEIISYTVYAPTHNFNFRVIVIDDDKLLEKIDNVVFTAIRLKIFSHLSNKIKTFEELSTKCLARPHLLKPLLYACISMGFINSKNDKYSNSHFSQIYLLEGKHQYVGKLIELQYTR